MNVKKAAIFGLLFLLSVGAVTSYFNYAGTRNQFPTFPLDDAWIFLGFARTFADSGELSINSATPPGPGVTSPGYLLLLTLFIKIGLTNEFLVSLVLNGLLLFVAAVLLYKIVERMAGNPWIAFGTALLFILDSRTLSLANGGMETIIFIALQLAVFYCLQRETFQWMFLFLGLAFWIRPEILIFLPIVLVLYWRRYRIKHLVFFAVPLAAYFVFLKVFTGYFWLNTGAAKTDFYSYITKWLYIKLSGLYLGGTVYYIVPALFLLGLFVYVRTALKGKGKVMEKVKRMSFVLVIVSYMLLFWLAFMFYLPVLYHFGRYLFPVLPLMLIVAAYGIKVILEKQKVLGFAVLAASVVLAVSLFPAGQRLYARECGDFLMRHVKLAHWIKENIPPGTPVATHDIGAVGYFADVRVIDLVGLMDKQAVGISRDPAKIKAYLDRNECRYVAVLNSWFVVENARLVFETPPGARVRFQVYEYLPGTRVVRRDVFNLESSGPGVMIE